MEDNLNRLPLIKNLIEVLNISGAYNGLVLGIDAGWNKGKTAFLNLWVNHLKENREDNILKFKVNRGKNG